MLRLFLRDGLSIFAFILDMVMNLDDPRSSWTFSLLDWIYPDVTYLWIGNTSGAN